MTTDEALSFLRLHQPLPSDAALTQQLIDKFDAIRNHFISNPNPACIPLMLNSFGNGSGYGVYQLCDDVFRQYTTDQLTPHLNDALRSPQYSVRYWAAHWAMDFHNSEMTESLCQYLDSKSNVDGHYFALAALASIWRQSRNQQTLNYILARKNTETDPEILEIIDEIILESNADNTT